MIIYFSYLWANHHHIQLRHLCQKFKSGGNSYSLRMLDTRPTPQITSLPGDEKMLLPSFRKLNEILFSNRQEIIGPVLKAKMQPSLKPKPQIVSRADSSLYSNLRYYTKLPCAPERIGRARRRPDQMQRFYGCRQNGCSKAYESISHLNTHIRRKGHGKPLTKVDFPEIYDQASSSTTSTVQ